MNIEIWRNILSQPDLLASSMGRIMVQPYIGVMPKGGIRMYGGHPTFGLASGNRLIYVRKGKSLKVHRLVCEAFHGPPGPDQVCMHLDENPFNNRPHNLAWGTQKQNLNAPGFIAYCRGRTGDNSPFRKGRIAKCRSINP